MDGWEGVGSQPTVGITSIICANDKCRKLSLSVSLGAVAKGASKVSPKQKWVLLPPSSAKPQPKCVPEVLANDYYEACAIRALSPKASATLIRRCLQGMIRDFCGISKRTLFEETNELRERVNAGKAPLGVQPDSVDAIDSVREIGNIGAHMQADINVIVDVDPDEAQILIQLTELLFDEWYVARDIRQAGLTKIKAIADAKKKQKQQSSAIPKEP